LLTGLQMRSARELLYSISRVLPIYQDGSIWQVCAVREEDV